MTSINPQYLKYLGTIILFAVAMILRLGAINETTVEHPIRADASDYYNYALNLKYHHTYSRDTFSGNTQQPDAVRAPGYPAFLVPFAEFPPTVFMLWKIMLAQALLDSLTVLLALGIYRRIMPEGWALGAGLLAAVSPHLISASTYLLTETLFTFLMMLSLWLVVTMVRNNSRGLAFAAGIVIAAAALTRPTLQFLVVPLAGMLLIKNAGGSNARLILPLLAGFILAYSPWTLRNLDTIGKTSDPTLTINALHHGMYPDMRYRDIPESTGVPYRFDPRSAEIASSKYSVLSEIRRRFEEQPGRHVEWYLLGKPVTLLSWDIIAGMGDIFIYPVTESPFLSRPVYELIHNFMELAHWPLVILALIATLLAWLPGSGNMALGTALFGTRVLSLVMLYFIALHIVAAPFPRYGIPLRPVIYGLALLQCSQILDWLRSVLAQRVTQPGR